MTPVRTDTALAGLGAFAVWSTFASTAAPARAVVVTALVLLPGRAFARRSRSRPGWRPRVVLLAAGLVVATTVELLDRLEGHDLASTTAALVLLVSSLALLRVAPRVPRPVPAPAVVPVLAPLPPPPPLSDVPGVATPSFTAPSPEPAAPAVPRAS